MRRNRLKRYITDIQDQLEPYLQTFWGNFALMSLVLFIWLNILPIFLAFQPMFRTDKWEAFAGWGVWLVVFMIILTALSTHAQSFAITAWDWTVLIVSGLWLLFVGWVRADDPTVVPAKDFGEAVLYATLWEYRATLVWISALWLEGIYWHRLYFVNQNRNKKIFWFWVIFSISLCITTVAYLMFAPMGFAVSLILPQKVFGAWLEARSKEDRTERGTPIEGIKDGKNQNTAQRKYNQTLRKDPDLVVEFGGIRLPMNQLVYGGAVFIGAVGSGKTLSMRLMMQDCLSHVYLGSGKRGIIYNPKRDIISILGGMLIGAQICVVDPCDRRCTRINFARTINSHAAAESFAHILVSPLSDGEHGERFFRDAAIMLITAATIFLINHAPGHWSLRDLCLIFDSEERLRAILGSDPDTAHYLDILATEKTAANVLASVKTDINKYRVIAALFDQAPYEISLEEWLAGGYILVLSHDDRFAPTLAAINRLIFTLATQMVLAEPETREARTFLFVDEMQLLHLDCLKSLLTRGRSKGAVFVGGTQAIGSLWKTLGKQDTETIMGQIEHKAFLRLNDPETANWASEVIGDAELSRMTGTYENESDFGAFLSHPNLHGYTEQKLITRAVMASELTNVPRIAPPRQGMTGYYVASHVWKNYYPWQDLQRMLIPPSTEADFLPVDDSLQRLRQWDESDWRRLDIYTIMQKLEAKKQQQPTSEQDEITSMDEIHARTAELREWLLNAHSSEDTEDENLISGNGATPNQNPNINQSSRANYRSVNQNAVKRKLNKNLLTPKQPPRNQNNDRDFRR